MKRAIVILATVAAGFLVVAPPFAANAATGKAVVFNSIPKTLPGNVPSVGFQATQASQFGDGIKLMPSGKHRLLSVKVVMSVWACQTGQWNTSCVTTPGATFVHPITFNIYGADTGGVPGSLIASITRPVTVKYRPSSDPTNCPSNTTAWFSAADNACYNGLAQTITFNFKNQHVVLPSGSSIVYGVAFNTSGYGAQPYGYSTTCAQDAVTGCAYDALNVAAAAGVPGKGTDRYLNGTFYDSDTGGQYCDGGTGGTGTFRLDNGCWAGLNPLVTFITH